MTGSAIFLLALIVLVGIQIAAKRFHPFLYWSVIVASTFAPLRDNDPVCIFAPSRRESRHVLRPIFSVRVHDDDSLDFLDPAGDHEPYGDSALVSDIAE